MALPGASWTSSATDFQQDKMLEFDANIRETSFSIKNPFVLVFLLPFASRQHVSLRRHEKCTGVEQLERTTPQLHSHRNKHIWPNDWFEWITDKIKEVKKKRETQTN